MIRLYNWNLKDVSEINRHLYEEGGAIPGGGNLVDAVVWCPGNLQGVYTICHFTTSFKIYKVLKVWGSF